ncbi:MAG: hypothetical protein IJ475_01680 [Bacilli bacterium]|nr:hypothetical protein [Bacilli bacterium]
MTIKKSKIIELTILLILIIILVLTIIFTYNIIREKPTNTKLSNDSYEITKYYKYKNNLEDITKFNIPYIEYIINESSSYKTTIKTIDKYIKYYEENINIRYSSTSPYLTEIENFCNSYNEIEHEYEFLCTFSINKIMIKNTYNLEQIDADIITTPKKSIKLLYKQNQKIDSINQNINLEELTK